MYELNIAKIMNVYYRENMDWSRKIDAPRAFDAVVLFTDGKIEYHFHDKSVTAQKGDLLFLPRNIPYKGEKHSDKAAYFVLDFVCCGDDEFYHFAAPAVFALPNYALMASKFSSALNSWNKQQINVQLELKAFAYSLISQAFQLKSEKESTRDVAEILDYVFAQLGDSSLKVSSLCEKFFISESQLRRKFIKATGLTPNEYILSVRINRAKEELICTGKPIRQISAECGFSSPYYFTRCFSQSEQITPTAYRKLHALI